MTDLKALAYELLGEAQSILQHEGHLNPAAVVITPSENLIFDLEFETDDERDELYSEMMDTAREKNASAILTVNDVYLDDEPSAPVRLEGEGWGALSESAHEAIVVTVSGSGFETWSLVSPYFRNDEQFVFQPPRETPDPGGEVALLGDWTGKTGAA
jgi:hypothetical protein